MISSFLDSDKHFSFHDARTRQYQAPDVPERPTILSRRHVGNFNQAYASKRKYIAGCFVRHIGAALTTRYVVFWYGYTLNDDRIQPSKHILYHYFTGYWQYIHAEKETSSINDNIDKSMQSTLPHWLQNFILMCAQNDLK